MYFECLIFNASTIGNYFQRESLITLKYFHILKNNSRFIVTKVEIITFSTLTIRKIEK